MDACYDVRFTANTIRNEEGIPTNTALVGEDIFLRCETERRIQLPMREITHRSQTMLSVPQAIGKGRRGAARRKSQGYTTNRR